MESKTLTSDDLEKIKEFVASDDVIVGVHKDNFPAKIPSVKEINEIIPKLNFERLPFMDKPKVFKDCKGHKRPYKYHP